ncbi:MAG: nucleoside triphosphate pyrophosphohydrolase [Congregibacter sp.]|nr:nucleoside triphosphate pyrophosphohydrolase [Congregibacter sp.]MDP5069513.1 nucleoside triphosphate pyrophosphohydrolase [Congregibacter sp.]
MGETSVHHTSYHTSHNTSYSLVDLLRIMQRLRDPVQGCPWDLQQDFQSIVPSTLEECYELAAAIEAGDYPHVADELGDVLFQVVFYAQLGQERGLFSFASVVHGLADKLLRRHPHVFAGGEIEGIVDPAAAPSSAVKPDAAAVKQQWEQIKSRERAERAQHGVLDDVPVALPALPRAQKLQKRAARVGFDWTSAAPVLSKIDEELQELRDAMTAGSADAIEDELGDLLFTVVNLARHVHVDAETALRRASRKFERRFRAMEADCARRGTALEALDAAAMELLWEQVKTST